MMNMLLEHSFIPIELSFFVFTFLRAHKNKTIAYGRNWNKHSLKKSPSMICKARSNKCMPLENFRRYLISLEVSRKIARVRKRKTNCAIITSCPFFLLVNSSCWTSFPWCHPCICISLDLSAPREKTLSYCKKSLWLVGRERPHTANKQVDVHNPIHEYIQK